MTVIQQGPGTTILTGTETFTGNTQVNVGTLLVSGGSISTTGTVSLAAGATLGTSGAATGGATLGTLTVGTLQLTLSTSGSGSTQIFDLAASGSSDSIAATTLALLGSGTDFLQLDLAAGSPILSGTYTLLIWTNTSVGALSDFAVAADSTASGGSLQLNDIGGTDELQYVVAAVPEPSVWVMALGGLAGLLLWRTRPFCRQAA
jgi:fibronectin-binding autotransporter adhesin